MTRLDQSAQPSREAAYKRLYVRIGVQDDCISWLLTELRALQKRVDKLEQHNAHTAANMVRAAHERAEEIWDELKQRDELSTPP